MSPWAEHSFPENKKENRGSPALCVSGNFQGKQRVCGAPFCFSRVSLGKIASFPESESWSGAKSGAKLRKSARYPGIFQVYRGFPGSKILSFARARRRRHSCRLGCPRFASRTPSVFLSFFLYNTNRQILGSEPSLRLVWAQNQPNFRPNRQNAGNFAENPCTCLEHWGT